MSAEPGVRLADETPERPRLVTVEKAAETLSLSVRSVYRLIERGELPTVSFGRSMRIDVLDLDALIEQHKKDTSRARRRGGTFSERLRSRERERATR